MYTQAFFGVRLGISNKLSGTIIHAYIKHHRNLNFSVALKNDLSRCTTFITFTKYLLKSLTYTLIKFPESSSGHGWVISPVHFGNVITFDVLNLIHCKISRKRNLIALRNFNLNIHLSIGQVLNKFYMTECNFYLLHHKVILLLNGAYLNLNYFIRIQLSHIAVIRVLHLDPLSHRLTWNLLHISLSGFPERIQFSLKYMYMF